ncbi:14702_t:CDS:2 [Funneliformis caledonium]|uniref:14702_t:CDS:1 n=1 Tax=Funneliformis caledonium TaxID=1117310 RepID=A0A9N9APS0_9GLOM|nr:14702_t:CDS:2 [Funneliformis caledonium]
MLLNKSKLCPKCPSIDDLEKERYYISLTFNGASKKRKRKDDLRKSTRGIKAQTIICELSIRSASEVSIGASPEDSNMRKVSNQFHKLYYKIDDAEKNRNRTIRDLVCFYFRFGKALSEQLAILLQSNSPQTAHTKLNKEIKEKLPKNANNDQFYDYISYSKHKRCQLSDRLAIAKNTEQKHALLNSQ